MKQDLVEVCDAQNEIIKKQSDLIDTLFLELAQYEEISDCDLEKIKEVAVMISGRQ